MPDREPHEPREPRDVLGEALYLSGERWRQRSRPAPWMTLAEAHREGWRVAADREIIARLAEAGYRIVKEGDQT